MCFTVSTTDQQLVTAYIQGDESAFAVLLQRHKSKVFGKIITQVRDRALAEDIFQDSMMRAITAIKGGNYNEEGKFLPWIMRIANNLCMDHFRGKKKMPVVRGHEDYNPFDFIGNGRLNAEQENIREEVMTVMRSLMDCLPREQREVVTMRLYFDMSFKEIAEQLDISINTALGRMRYALINLRKHVEQHHLDMLVLEDPQ
jgi:RNA polymerase sigma factor (sigma-70 family)